MSAAVVVVDYGFGNLKSVCRALEFSGGAVDLTSNPAAIADASRLVLPGVGAFASCIGGLRNNHLVEAIARFFGTQRPFLGICVGMQMLLDSSEEFGEHSGLGLIPGKVRAIPAAASVGAKYKVPHIGWSQLRRPADATWAGTIVAGCDDGEPMYFVHSFTAEPQSSSARLADCDYFGNRLSGVIRDGDRYGCQFHPEKSGESGLGVLSQFLAL